MTDYIYQIQKKTRCKEGWIPVYRYRSSTPMEYKDLDTAVAETKSLKATYDDIRLVRIETTEINVYGN